MDERVSRDRVSAVRRFNRFYTRHVGALNEGLLNSPFSLTEARVLYELAHRQEGVTAAELSSQLSIDPGYLSRLLRGFRERRLIDSESAPEDARRNRLQLTRLGRRTFQGLNHAAQDEVALLLRKLSPGEQDALLGAMQTIERLLGGGGTPPFVLRPFRVGDMGWIVHRQAVLYATEYGWDQTYEALVAEIVARFIREFDRQREACWIAETEGAPVGSVFLVKEATEVARLRLLYVEPRARGRGIGAKLVEECIVFARRAGYRKMVLWTNDILGSARMIYVGAGFKLVAEEPHHSFGRDLIGQTWELELGQAIQ